MVEDKAISQFRSQAPIRPTDLISFVTGVMSAILAAPGRAGPNYLPWLAR